eukprot:6208873-Pleurochrysis_carterae.AAC.13
MRSPLCFSYSVELVGLQSPRCSVTAHQKCKRLIYPLAHTIFRFSTTRVLEEFGSLPTCFGNSAIINRRVNQRTVHDLTRLPQNSLVPLVTAALSHIQIYFCWTAIVERRVCGFLRDSGVRN